MHLLFLSMATNKSTMYKRVKHKNSVTKRSNRNIKHNHSSENAVHGIKSKDRPQYQKWFGIVFICLICIISLIGIGIYIRLKQSIQTISVATILPEKTEELSLVEKSFSQLYPIYISLVGYGGPGHDGPYLTDTIMIARLDPKYKTIHLISLPRDLWVPIQYSSSESIFKKINEAYSIGKDDKNYPEKSIKYTGKAGAGNLLKDTLSYVSGINVDRFFSIDFKTFSKVIDKLGGIDVVIDTSFTDEQYPITGNENELCGRNEDELPMIQGWIATDESALIKIFPCRYETLTFKKGKMHMDGTTALKFVRSRHSAVDGNDFARSNRQKNVLQAIKNKVYTINFVPKIPTLLSELEKGIQSDFSEKELLTLLSHGDELRNYTIHSITISDDNVLKNSIAPTGQYILTTHEGIGNFESMKLFINDEIVKSSTAEATPSAMLSP